MPPPSTCACRCFRGRRFVPPRPPFKLHTLLDLRGAVPSVMHVSDGKMHDVNVLDLLVPEAGAFSLMDRASLDFERLSGLAQVGACFVTRAQSNLDARRLYSAPVDRRTGLICAQTLALTGFYSRQHYPQPLRRIRLKDPATGKALVFLTTHFQLPPLTIGTLDKNRWHVELFFAWIKQHLRITRFFGTSENAVKPQIWTAVSVYVLIAIIKKRLNLEVSRHTRFQILSVTLFETIELTRVVTDPAFRKNHTMFDNQLNSFDS